MLLHCQARLELLLRNQLRVWAASPWVVLSSTHHDQTPSERIDRTLLIGNAGPNLLQVYHELLLLQIQFAFDLAQHLIADTSLVAQPNDGSPLGCEHLLA